MKITIINGTNRINNTSIVISKYIQKLITEKNIDNYIVTLDNFDTLFRGEYITLDNANIAQKIDLENIISANALIYVIPIYHKGIPSSLKNFIDIVSISELLENKIIALISSNRKSVEGAHQTVQILHEYMAFKKNYFSFILPEINIIDPFNIDSNRISNLISNIENLASKLK